MFLPLLLVVLGVGDAAAQFCENYGVQNGSGCSCPPGFGGASCSQVACGGTLFAGAGRPLAPANGVLSNVTGCSCESGWTGTGCNVCTSSGACEAAYNDVRRNQSVPALPSAPLSNAALTCNTQPRIYAAGEMSCQVVNPSLKALFPLRVDLAILRTLDPALSPLPNTMSFGPAGSVFMQLFYDGVEQFYCAADSCSQDDATWACGNLACTCRPGTSFCGAQPTTNLAQTINSLAGDVALDCAAGTACLFRQQTLQTLFGAQGLVLADCAFGECVAQAVVAPASGVHVRSGAAARRVGGAGFVRVVLTGMVVLVLT